MATGSAKYRGSKEYLLVYSEMIRAARYRGLITYQDIAEIMGLPLEGNLMAKETGRMLGEISEDEHAQNRPMLSAVVVSTSGTPGPGFYALAKQFGKLQAESEQAHRPFWEKERDSVYAAWKKVFKPK